MITKETKSKLIENALLVRTNAYAPYSHFTVGASVISNTGIFYGGCNIENASYGATNCAERTAIFKGVSEGMEKIAAIAVAGGNEGEEPDSYVFPCGICLQVIREFADPEKTLIIVAKSTDDFKEYLLKDLMPESFGPDALK